MTLPLAHVGHYLWVLYLLPVAIVVGGIVRAKYQEKKSPTSDGPSSPKDKHRARPGGQRP